MQNPILTDRTNFFSYIGIWLLVACMQVILVSISEEISFGIALADGLITNLLYSAIGIGLWYPIFFSKNDRENHLSTIINNLITGVITISLWLGISYLLLVSLFNANTEFLNSLRKSLPWRAGIGFLYYEVLILVYYLIIFYRNNKENQLKEAELKALVKESELNSLKAQINPHFLFNSLNSISSLTMIEPAKAQEMIIKLSEFLRYATSNKEEKFTSLKDELNNINRYLDIEKVRFGKRLAFRQSVEDSCRQLKLPGLILQPLVENAVKYSVYENTEESVIEIQCTCNSSALSVVVRNQWDPDFQFNKGEGVGLKNIRSRMRILYNRDDLFSIRKDPLHYEVNIIFPQS
jgi:two-component system LytT family sensor kinase